MSTTWERRERKRQRKRESRRQASGAKREKERQWVTARDKQRKQISLEKQHEKFIGRTENEKC